MSDFKVKMHQIRFRLGLCPKPRWGAYNAPTDSLAGFERPIKGRREREGRGKGKRKGGGEGRGKDPLVLAYTP